MRTGTSKPERKHEYSVYLFVRQNGEAVAGLGSVNIASDAPEFRLSGGGQESYGEIVLQGNVTLSPSQTTSFYFVVPPQVFSKGMTFKITGTVNGQQQTLTKATERSITVAALL